MTGLLHSETLEAPVFEIEIAGQRLGEDISRFIDNVTYESADGIADVGKFVVQNPNGIFTDKKLFQPGNEANFFFGYDALDHVGRVQLVKPRFNFPDGGMPTIEVVGYTRDHQMMDNSPEKKKPRVWPEATLFQILEDKASVYGFNLDVDDYAFKRSIVQKPGMSDYDLVRGLANFLGYLFWVDGDAAGRWILHFKDPKRSPIDQEKKYTLQYDFGNNGSLYSFSPEYAIRDARTKIRVETRNADTGKTISETFEDDAARPDLESNGDPNEEIDRGLTTGAAVKLFFGDFSIDIVANKRFRDAYQLRAWAEQWFRRNREDFVIGQGSSVGIQHIMARHTHRIEGFGRALDGDYYFPRVAHAFSSTGGYKLDFTARKVITDSNFPQNARPRRPLNTRTFREPAI